MFVHSTSCWTQLAQRPPGAVCTSQRTLLIAHASQGLEFVLFVLARVLTGGVIVVGCFAWEDMERMDLVRQCVVSKEGGLNGAEQR
jgi:hypothetical protein